MLHLYAGNKVKGVKAGVKKAIKKQAATPAPGPVPGPTVPSAAVAAVLEGHGILMGSSVDEHHLIHKPPKVGLAAADITGAMAMADAMQHLGSIPGHSPTMMFGGYQAGIGSFGASARLPEWPPAGSLGKSPAMMMFGTPPLGRSVDMVDVCTQLMEAGVDSMNMGSLRQELMLPGALLAPHSLIEDEDEDELDHEMMIMGQTPASFTKRSSHLAGSMLPPPPRPRQTSNPGAGSGSFVSSIFASGLPPHHPQQGHTSHQQHQQPHSQQHSAQQVQQQQQHQSHTQQQPQQQPAQAAAAQESQAQTFAEQQQQQQRQQSSAPGQLQQVQQPAGQPGQQQQQQQQQAFAASICRQPGSSSPSATAAAAVAAAPVGSSLQHQAQTLLRDDATSEESDSDDDMMGMSPDMPSQLLFAAGVRPQGATAAAAAGYANVFQQAFRMHAQGPGIAAGGVSGWAPAAPVNMPAAGR
eukprot:GHRR01007476.1.p1 GENE.GHRR01007476.1~~GHRR01007476.1.p1  ORF type:complete len:468 (+),score=244.37 GHRR01007476.1:1181-2584(+)